MNLLDVKYVEHKKEQKIKELEFENLLIIKRKIMKEIIVLEKIEIINYVIKDVKVNIVNFMNI